MCSIGFYLDSPGGKQTLISMSRFLSFQNRPKKNWFNLDLGDQSGPPSGSSARTGSSLKILHHRYHSNHLGYPKW